MKGCLKIPEIKEMEPSDVIHFVVEKECEKV